MQADIQSHSQQFCNKLARSPEVDKLLCRFDVLVAGEQFSAEFQGTLAAPEAADALQNVLTRLSGMCYLRLVAA